MDARHVGEYFPSARELKSCAPRSSKRRSTNRRLTRARLRSTPVACGFPSDSDECVDDAADGVPFAFVITLEAGDCIQECVGDEFVNVVLGSTRCVDAMRAAACRAVRRRAATEGASSRRGTLMEERGEEGGRRTSTAGG